MHRHLSETELVDALLESGEPATGLLDCPVCARAAAELEAFFDDCRSTAHAELTPSPAFIDRVLATTTREDLAWRGDLSLLAGFVRERLSASPLLRVAAASLLVHLLALPVLAWLAFRPAPPETSFRAYFEHREQGLPAEPVEPEWELEIPVLPEPESLSAAESLADTLTAAEAGAVASAGDGAFGAGLGERGSRSQRERAYLIRRGGPPLVAPSTDADLGLDPVAELLWIRAGRLNRQLDPLAVLELEPPLNTPLERALWAELLMDHLVLERERLPALDRVLERLWTAADSNPSGEGGASQATVELIRLTLDRAEALGLSGGDRDRARSPAQSPDGPSAQTTHRPGRPVGQGGFGAALTRVLGDAGSPWADWDR